MSERRETESQRLRYLLLTVGIKLDDEAPPKPPRPATPPPPEIDRAKIREVLAAAGAPERDLDWMTASCPHLAAALAYSPTVREQLEDATQRANPESAEERPA